MTSDPPRPEQVLQSILQNVQVSGNLTTGDISQIVNLFISINQPESFNPTGIPQNIPSSGTIKFVGRSEELERLHQMLQQNNQVVIAAIAGMGGVGKTELAIQYALLHLLLLTYPGSICWLRAREEDIGFQVVQFAQTELGLKPPEDLDLPKQVRWCWRRWREENVLVVLDDVNDYLKVEPYLPPQPSQFKVLITTRLQLDLPQSLTLDVLGEIAALDLLQQWVEAETINQHLIDAKELCQRLGYLPLALNLVGRYIKKRKISLPEMLRRLEGKGLQHKALDVDKYDRAWTLNVNRGVAAAFELSWEELSEEAKQLGCLLSLFALAPISWALVESVEIKQDSEDLEDARVELESLHLIQGEETYRLHPLIREFFQEKLEQLELADKLKQAFATVIAAVAEQIPHPDSLTLDLINAIAHSISHIEEATTTLTDFLRDEEFIVLTASLGKFYQGRGFYERAEFWLEKYLFFMKYRVGLDHPYVAFALNNRGYLYYAQGRYVEAEQAYKQALKLWQPRMTEGYAFIATILNNRYLYFYYAQGRSAEAEVAYKQALNLWQDWMTNGYAFIADILNNLALLYFIQDYFSEAEPLFEQAFQIRKSLFGEEHLDVAMSLNNLGAIYEVQKRYTKAESLYQQALKIRKSLLGDEHPNVSLTLNNLAYLYYTQGRYSEAEPIYQQVLEIDQRLHGNEHLNVACDLNNLAALYCQQGHYDKAEPLFRQSLKLRKHLLGGHPYVAESLSSLAGVCCFQGRYSEALPLYWQALAIYEQQLGLNHTQTVIAQKKFAVCLRQAILKGCADIESLPNNLTVQAILATVQASLEKSE